MMTRVALGLSLGIGVLAIPAEAHAQYGNSYGQVRNVQCERQRATDQTTGVVVGALVGALAGGALGNEIGDNRKDSNAYRSYGRGYGYRHGYYGGYGGKDDNDAEVAVGALLGAVAGGIAGNQLGGRRIGECQVAYAPSYGYDSPPGSIPRTTDGLYGGPEVYGGPSYPERGYAPPPQRYPAGTPSYPAYPDGRYDPPARDCRVIHRETRMPDGEVQRDPVTACWDPRTREWRVQDGYSDSRYGY